MHGAPGTTAKEQDALDEKSKKDQAASTTLIGYARMDIITHEKRLQFGKYNPRRVDNGQVQKLLESFYINEVDCYLLDHLIHLFVDKKILSGQCWTEDKYGGKNLPEVAIVENASANWCFVAAGGQHRLGALKLWVARMKKLLEEKKEEENTVMNQSAEDDLSQTLTEHLNNVLRPQLASLKDKVSSNGSWIVALYDKGTLSITPSHYSLPCHIPRKKRHMVFCTLCHHYKK